MMADAPLLIIGASARAAAQSAVSAGFAVAAIDLFADADLVRSAGPLRQSVRFPHDLLALERELPAGDWLYVGGLENYPRVVDRLAARRRLLGNPGDLVRRVRDLGQLADWARRAEVAWPETLAADARPAADGRWLVKRKRSAAGLGIAPLGEGSAGGIPGSSRRGVYLQRRIEGVPYGVVYLGNGSQAQLVGLTEQLPAPAGTIAAPFRYGGSITASAVQAQRHIELERLGSALMREFPLQGLFGVDIILDPAGRLWLLEINPRPTASVEVHERTWGVSLLKRHVAACRTGRLAALPPPAEVAPFHGRKIVYARARGGVATQAFTERLLASSSVGPLPEVADIPAAGVRIEPDQPLVSVAASAASRELLLTELADREERVLEAFLRECA